MTEMKQELASVKTELREGLAAVKENLTNDSLTETVNNMEQNSNDEQTTGLRTQLDMVKSLLISVNISMSEGFSAVNTSVSEGLSAVNTSMSEGLSAVKTELQEHRSQTASELAGLETNQETIDSKLDSLDSKQDGLSMTVTTAHSELERNVLTNVPSAKQ
jgi:chromosome segregation ATPase